MKKFKNFTIFEEDNILNALVIDEDNNEFVLTNVQLKQETTVDEEINLNLNITFDNFFPCNNETINKAEKIQVASKGD